MNDSTASDNPAEVAPDPPGDGADAPSQLEAPHDAFGAYLLDALPEEERLAYERHLADCTDCRREITALRPVIGLLPLGLGENGEDAAEEIAEPGSDLRDRILAAVRADEATEVRGVAAPTAPAEASDADASIEAPARPARPRGRIRPGFAQGAEPVGRPLAAVPWAGVSRANRGWLAAAGLALVAVGALTWALLLQGRLDDRRDEIRAQQALIDEIREQANATAYTLVAPTDAANPSAAPAASGSLFFSLRDRQGVLLVRGLAPLPAEQAYQLWYINEAGPQPGQTFQVNEQGDGVVIVGSDVQTFDQVALTTEPRSGSQVPTSAIVLSGSVGGAAG